MPGFGNYESAAIGPLRDVFAESDEQKVPSELVMRLDTDLFHCFKFGILYSISKKE